MAKCFKKGCETTAEEGSNYCASHVPGKLLDKKVMKVDQARENAREGSASKGYGAPGPRPPPK